jgi:uncharacterized protein (TIGR04255 family)
MSELQHWKPDNAAHSVQQVVARLIFNQEVTDVPWKKIAPIAKEAALKLDLTTENAVQEINFQVLQSGPRGPQTVQAGAEYLRLEREGFFSDKFIATKRELVFEEWRYTRWAALAEKIRETVILVSKHYFGSVALNAIQLQYVDRFEAADPNNPVACSEVLRFPGKFISEAAFSEDQPWHSHSGFFEKVSSTVRRLGNVNIDVADLQTVPMESPIRMVRITTTLTDLFNQPTYDAFDNDSATAEFLEERLQHLHIRSKDIFAQIVTDAAASKVSLKG